MRCSVRLVLAGLAPVVAAVAPAAARAQQAIAASTAASTASVAPDVGAPAPDFTLAAVGASGQSAPVSLGELRGKVVVLAFYPKDRTGGCTAELTKFRDEYATLFPGASRSDVVVVPVSADGIASHADWAKESKFPFALASDSTLAVADRYGSRKAEASYANRTVFVIGRDGVVKYRDLQFNALSQDAYTRLTAAVAQAAKK